MDVVSAVLKTLLGRPADIVIKDLSRNSRHLQELDQLLRFKLAKIDICSFYELLPMNPAESPIGLDADHRQMCKHSDRHHVLYETIAQRILNYSNELLAMTNKFAAKQMDHILALTTELHEGQTDSNLTSMFISRQVSGDLLSQTIEPQAVHTHGFEEVLKSLPIHQVEMFVNGVQKLMDRAKSLQDLLLEAERQNEGREAQALIETERKISAQRLQTLAEEKTRLKKLLHEAK
ncbi:hypothetical protein SLS53_003902 [Cytospora paraplurivora]|uniref:Uncharacterized protein n=1 Tax=Cytospora paraplurivora TaxID=2898453 RepID=A0AAN9UBM8_9PEZI